MRGVKYLIPEISALDIISSAKGKDGEYSFYFDTTEISKEYMVKETLQDDCPIFYQAMCFLKERMMLGMNIGKCQLSKLYAYNALLFTSGRRIENNALFAE